ncbi:MAG: hypothetical protein M0Z31_12455, partial [Clostridia bacterium]|nr:hypothetical protein [Clostridia bacterium]
RMSGELSHLHTALNQKRGWRTLVYSKNNFGASALSKLNNTGICFPSLILLWYWAFLIKGEGVNYGI